MADMKLSEFQKLTGLSDEALFWLLREEKLACSVDEHGSIYVNPEHVAIKKTLSEVLSIKREVMSEHVDILSEKCGKLIDRKIDELTSEAIEQLIRQSS